MNVSHVCVKCGSKVFAIAPQGLCSVCLFKTALGSLQDDHENAESSTMPGPMEFGDYELLEEIGRGGQGVVYRARQKSLNRIVALKVIGLGRWATELHLKRFRLEAEATARLNHPSIVPIHEIGEGEGCCYFSMNLIEGGPLDEVARRESMPIRRAVELMAKLARTVHYAHEHGILHRDLKPGNILLDREGNPHLTDFGLARLLETESNVTRTMDVLGTPSYIAPEQASGNNAALTSATDTYGLGAVLYHLLTGRPPFAGATTYETIRLVLETDPRPPRLLNPKVDHDLSTICLKCLEKDPERRYLSALALAEDLERWLRHDPIQARRTGVVTRGRKWLRRNPAIGLSMVSLAGLFAATGLIVWKSHFFHSPPPTGIAVLPFENLSENKANAFFADGVQDDILTKLAQVADLKVISRTSVMSYRGALNIRQIGRALQVSHVLEGSVRRDASRIHLNFQLIDTRTDTHIWAKAYDRDLSDLFAIQSEVSQEVAQRLHARISATEKRSLSQAPTADLAAFDLYVRARNLFLTASFSNTGKQDLVNAADLLNQAVARDPSFYGAYCQLVWIHDLLYNLGHDHTPGRLALAEAAIQAAFRLQPDGGEAHAARADNLYRAHLDYNGALAEVAAARRGLPNDPRLFELAGYIERRQGRHEAALASLQRAAELDPRNVFLLRQVANSEILLSRYAEAKAAFNHALSIAPDDVLNQVGSGWVEFEWKADTRPLHHTIDSVRLITPAFLPRIVDGWLVCALAERDAASAKEALIAAGANTPLNDQTIHFNRSFVEGVIARMEKDEARARAAFMAARAEQEQTVHAQPDYAPPLCVLGMIDAALGRREEALREAHRAVELLPVEKDALNGPMMIKYLALTATWLGDKDLACEQLANALRYPGFVSYGQLKLYPLWDPLRGDPRFEKMVNSLAPK